MVARALPRLVQRLASLGALLLLVATLAACGDDGDSPAAVTTTEPPTSAAPSFEVTGTDFYTPPDPLPDGEHGDLIWAEPIDSWWGSPRQAWRVLYRSESLEGEDIAVSGYVIAPADTSGTEPLPVLAWAHETVGSADVCAPSRTFADQAPTTAPRATVAAQLSGIVDAGAVVVASDYEGLGTPGPHPFLVGESAGRSVLDAVRAAGQLTEVNAGTDTLLYGASQGGQAALWAAQVAPEWTPELDVLGVVAVAPFSEVDLLLPAAATVVGAEGYLVLGVYGQAAANSDLDPTEVLDPAVVEEAAIVEERCVPDVHVAFRQLAAETGRPPGDLDALRSAEWQEQLASLKPGTGALDVPVLLAQGDRDTTIPAATTKILATRMCASGDEVETLNKPDAGHSEIVTAADAEIRDWLAARLAGEAATSNCSR
jgi:pimeloyl-ACP methyl ester carboxylesterase